ncbi:heavy metal-responsive transcriptional regulator [Leptolyngbya ohadii]|uniref:heavy metal-responsive transcriptional regulator n=1 Tax=Leptolyngbya ohadii TaxID=1962290 RepID=UPI000B599DC8|nr:heavy metal-responsive transcriptional regulator [Leptolyngbya ohadii]
MITSNTIESERLLKIGEVATESGLPIKTIRYYDDIGLLAPTVERSKTGYRLFSVDVLDRLTFIKRAQSLGLHLNEIQQILSVHDQGELPCGQVKHYLEDKVAEITRQIESLQLLRSQLQGILAGWQEPMLTDQDIHTICPNLQPDYLQPNPPA